MLFRLEEPRRILAPFYRCHFFRYSQIGKAFARREDTEKLSLDLLKWNDGRRKPLFFSGREAIRQKNKSYPDSRGICSIIAVRGQMRILPVKWTFGYCPVTQLTDSKFF